MTEYNRKNPLEDDLKKKQCHPFVRLFRKRLSLSFLLSIEKWTTKNEQNSIILGAYTAALNKTVGEPKVYNIT